MFWKRRIWKTKTKNLLGAALGQESAGVDDLILNSTLAFSIVRAFLLSLSDLTVRAKFRVQVDNILHNMYLTTENVLHPAAWCIISQSVNKFKHFTVSVVRARQRHSAIRNLCESYVHSLVNIEFRNIQAQRFSR